MTWETFLSEYLVFVWVGVFFVWMVWVPVKVYNFKRQTQLQQAISKPQLRQLSIRLLKGTLWAFFFASLVGLLPAVILKTGRVRENTPMLFCIIPMILSAFGYLLSEIQILRVFFRLPFTDQKVVPIPEPPPLPPYADKSFEDLSLELDKALETIKGTSNHAKR
jgi:ABC-type Fe3+ transport system permease subunit